MSAPGNNPLVTVVCATYNSRATLRFALRSVLNQDFTDFEVRIVGDACTDGTEGVVAEFNDPRLHWHNLPRNSGSQSVPNNEGIRQARGKYIALIGHDDLWFPWHLSRLVRHLENEHADLVHDLAVGVGIDGIINVCGPPRTPAEYPGRFFPPSSWLHRRELAAEVGFWRNANDLFWPIDYDFTRRAALAGKRISFLPSVGVLKFFSIIWKPYANKQLTPQAEYLAAILEAPQALQEKVLLDLSVLLAKETRWVEPLPFGLAWNQARKSIFEAVRATAHALVHWYGTERWPVGPFLCWRGRRVRSRVRVHRGLPTLKDSGL